MIEEKDLAYAAGIIDGEGCLYIYEKKPGRHSRTPEYQMGVNVSMTDVDTIKWLWQKWNGNLSARIKKENWRPQLQWRVASKLGLKFLKDVYPYLKVKKREAMICIRFQEDLIEKQKYRKGFVGSLLPDGLIRKRQSYRSLLRLLIKHRCIWSGVLEGLPSHVVKKFQET